MGLQGNLAWNGWAISFFDKETGTGYSAKSNVLLPNGQLANTVRCYEGELPKLVGLPPYPPMPSSQYIPSEKEVEVEIEESGMVNKIIRIF